jgi:PAS domain S-box-containing protein
MRFDNAKRRGPSGTTSLGESTSPRDRPAVWRYGLATFAVAAATLLSLWLRPFDYATPFLFFYSALILVSWIGGLSPGLLATALASAAINYFLFPPYNSFSLDASSLIRTMLFAVVCAIICWLAEHARKQLHTKLHFQAAALESAANSIVITDREGTILWVNPAFTKLTGYTAEEVLGQTPRLLKSGRVDEHIYREMWTTILSGAVWAGEVVNRRKDGSLYVEDMTITPVRSETGEISHFVSIKVDITERKRWQQELLEAKEVAETSLAQLRTMLDSMSEGVYVSDAEGKPLLVNRAFFQLHGFDKSSLPQDTLELVSKLEVYDADGRFVALPDRPIPAALRGETIRQRELRVRRMYTGKEVFLSHNATPVRDGMGKVIMAVLTIEDITVAKQAEAALIRSEKLAVAGRLAATMAHEINNPLAAMMNIVYILGQSPTQENIREYLSVLDAQLRTISRITNQTLKFHRDSGRPMEFRLSELIAELLEFYEPKAKKHGVAMAKRLEVEGQVVAFSSEIRQVISNLLINAIEATPQGGRVTVHLHETADRRNGDVRGYRIAVADTGSGIDLQHLPRIFEPFFTTKGEKGTGLGLWVSMGIIDRAGGSMRVRTTQRPGRSGTCFSVFLPATVHAVENSGRRRYEV